MQAVTFSAHGDRGVIEYGEFPDPDPDRDEALVDVKAGGLNHLDVWTRRGLPGVDLAMPHVPGSAPLVFRTAWRMLHTRADVEAGESVLALGASGGVGHAAVQIADHAGAEVYAPPRPRRHSGTPRTAARTTPSTTRPTSSPTRWAR